jgi:hypothetical protein
MVGPRCFDKDEHLLIIYAHAQLRIYQGLVGLLAPPAGKFRTAQDKKNEKYDEENSEERVKIDLREELKAPPNFQSWLRHCARIFLGDATS